jgi:hypothetical protein
MKQQAVQALAVPYAAFVGVDWADQQHEVCELSPMGQQTATIPQRVEAIGQWIQQLRQQYGEGPIAIALEQRRGALIYALMQYENLVLFPINPKQLARYREARSPSGAKDDPGDAALLAEFVRNYHQQLRAMRPEEPRTRELARLCEMRRRLVNQRTKCVQQLADALKQYFPLALELVGPLKGQRALALLARWPSHQELRRAHPDSLRRFWRQYYRREERVEALVERARQCPPLTRDPALIKPYAMLTQVLVRQMKVLQVALEQFEQRIAEL